MNALDDLFGVSRPASGTLRFEGDSVRIGWSKSSVAVAATGKFFRVRFEDVQSVVSTDTSVSINQTATVYFKTAEERQAFVKQLLSALDFGEEETP